MDRWFEISLQLRLLTKDLPLVEPTRTSL